MDHLETNNFATTAYHPRDLGGLKGALGISPAMQSCHTGMVDDQYVFEGHVPAKHIKAFLANPPEGRDRTYLYQECPLAAPAWKWANALIPIPLFKLMLTVAQRLSRASRHQMTSTSAGNQIKSKR
jgi:hypothetical protein